MSFSFQSGISKAKVKRVILKIDTHHVLHQRAEKREADLQLVFLSWKERA